MSKEPIFSDYLVRKAMNQLGAKPQHKDGDDTDFYRLSLHIRNKVEEYLLENYFVGNVVPVDQQRGNAVIREMAAFDEPKERSNLLLDILADPEAENVLAKMVHEPETAVVLPDESVEVYTIPVFPTYELDEEGVPTGRKMIFENLSGGEHRWGHIDNPARDPDLSVMLQKRDGIKWSEGFMQAQKEIIGGDPHPITVRYLRRTHRVSA